MSSVRMRVASRDWWASRRMVSVTLMRFLLMVRSSKTGVGSDGAGDSQGQGLGLVLGRVVGQLGVGVDEAGVEHATAEIRVLEDFLVVEFGGLHPVQVH